MDHAVCERGAQVSSAMARELEADLAQFLAPLVAWLDTLLEKRLMRTLVASIFALVEWRNRARTALERARGVYL